MKDRDALLQVLEQLAAEVQDLNMAHTVQRSAYVLLVRHLAAQGLVRPGTLATDLQTMADTQPDAGWQSGHAELSGALQLLHAGLPAQPRAPGRQDH